MKKKVNGFTIVELLIVIVVIAILATISVVAYNGIQERAKAAQMASAFNTYENALRQYKAIHGLYPVASDALFSFACLGDSNPQTPLDSDTCYLSGGAKLGGRSSIVNTALSTIISSTPTTDNQINLAPDTAINGFLYTSLNGTGGQTVILRYYVRGDQQCGNATKSSHTVNGISFTGCAKFLE